MVVLRILTTLLLSGIVITLIATILEVIASVSLDINPKAEKIINHIFFIALIATLSLGVISLIMAIVLKVPTGGSSYTPVYTPIFIPM